MHVRGFSFMPSVFSACGSLGEPGYGKQMHAVSIKYGLEGDAFSGCSLTDMYAKCGLLCSAKTAFDLIQSPDIVSWNALISGFAYSGDFNGAMSIFSQMRHLDFRPDDISVRSLLCAFVNPLGLSQGKQVHSYIIKTRLDLDIPVCNTLLTTYANCSSYMDAYKLFNENRVNADLVSWNAIITMCVNYQQVEEVFLLFRTMLYLFHGKPDHITIANLLGSSGKIASLHTGDQVYCYSFKTGLDFDFLVMNALIDMYVKCGSLERARKLFDSIGYLDIVSWSSLIVGYAQFGYGDEALNLFTKMKNLGLKPNQVTFVGVLTACSHVGLVEEGLKLFESMETEHKVVPTREHYSCVVDLLARGGLIQDAEAFINEMGIEPDIVMWKTLLAACKTRKNIDVGKRVAERILKIDPYNSAAHVLLCSIYASAGDWKDVALLRSLMREKGVKKVPGRSWIEVNDRSNVFSAEDGLHPERDKIYSMLEELWLQILDAGYLTFLE
ncbi:hypothetical protein ACJIZ3_025805 [Penstemon smallii]|uniref:Pentatricopeptide repeat-containing protein n=1 Tax=Penstemon smallii TaxID=265156 RepID=A0ABD3TVK4_9LAMI